MNTLRIALGDLKRVAKDWRATLWLLAMPLAFAYVFGSAIHGGGSRATWIPVVNLDRHELADLFIDQLREEGCWVDVKGPEAQAELKQKWPYGIVIPAGFGQALLEGKPIKLPLVKGEASSESFLEVQSRLTHAIVRFTKGLVLADVSHRQWTEASRTALKDALGRPQLLTLALRGHRTLRPPPSGFSQSLPGMLVMFVLQMVFTYGGAILVKDRAGGQLSRLVAAPLFRFEVYAGKALARVLLALMQAIVLLVCGSIMFGVPLGDHPLFLLPAVLCLAAFAGCLSILGGVVCQTEKQVILLAMFGSMILAGLGGCWWPIEIVPDLFKTIALFTPSYWAVHALQSVLYFGKSYEILTLECPVLLGFTAVLGLLALFSAKLAGKKPGSAGGLTA
jgi:ABC-type multidrug transport system permease subunit